MCIALFKPDQAQKRILLSWKYVLPSFNCSSTMTVARGRGECVALVIWEFLEAFSSAIPVKGNLRVHGHHSNHKPDPIYWRSNSQRGSHTGSSLCLRAVVTSSGVLDC